MFDFGSILGSGTVYAQRHRAGNEYIFEQRPGWLTLATLGVYVRPWMLIDYPDVPPSIGRFEARRVRSGEVEARVSEPGVREHAAGRCVLGGADRRALHRRDDRRRSCEKAQYSDPRATEYMTQTLITRRDKVVATWLNQVCPVVDPVLAGRRRVHVRERGGRGASRRRRPRAISFSGSASTTPPTRARRRETPERSALAGRAPAGLLDSGEFVGVEVTALHPQHPGWARPATFFFRRAGPEWTLVGVERG